MAGDSTKKTSRKLFFSMGEVAELFDVNPSLIRFWEKRFDILRPKKNAKGNRLFTPADIENLKLIHHLVKEKGMTLGGAEKYLKDNKNALQRDVQIVERLQHVRSMLLEIKEELGAESSQTQIVVKRAVEVDLGTTTVEDALGTTAVGTTMEDAFFEGVRPLPDAADAADASDVPGTLVAAVAAKQQKESAPRYIEQTLFDF